MSEQELLIEDINVWDTPMFALNNPEHSRLKQPLLDAIYRLRDAQSQAIESEVAPSAVAGVEQ